MKSYDNLIEALSDLKKDGYEEDFNLKQNCIVCRDGQYKIFHNEFEMTRVVDGDLVKVMAWYGNEWGFTNQMIRQIQEL